MSDANELSGGQNSERELLMGRARLLGISFSNNIGTDTLRARVNAKMKEIDGDDAGEEAEEAAPEAPASDEAIEEVVDTSEAVDPAPESFDDDIEEEEPAEEESSGSGTEEEEEPDN